MRVKYTPLFVWTVYNTEEARRVAALDVAGIITDIPDMLLSKS
jgi:hypothetical protein